MATAEGKRLPFVGPEHIDVAVLETFPYEGPKQVVTYSTNEFSAVCPFSGLPDIAKVDVEYVPNKKVVELKSLKYYYLSYRNVGIYQEDMTARVYKDLFAVLQPTALKITTVYQTRGGIDTTCVVDSKAQ